MDRDKFLAPCSRSSTRISLLTLSEEEEVEGWSREEGGGRRWRWRGWRVEEVGAGRREEVEGGGGRKMERRVKEFKGPRLIFLLMFLGAFSKSVEPGK